VGIFAGGFSLDAATAVCGGAFHSERSNVMSSEAEARTIAEIDILDLLSSLTDKSLVVADTTGEQERYHLLESTRAYALERLTATGARERLARRHAEYFRDQAQEADERSGTGSRAAWLASVQREVDNYRAVLEWALKDGHDRVLGGAVAGALQSLWHDGGLTVEGRYWLNLAQAGLDESMHPRVAARLWHTLSWLASGKRRHDGAQRAFALHQAAGDETGQAWALVSLAFSLNQMGRLEEARDVNARAFAAMRKLGVKSGVAGCLNMQAIIQQRCGDIAGARESNARALAAYKDLGNESGTALVLTNLAELDFGDGRIEQAVHLAGEVLEIRLRGKNATNLAICYLNIAAYRTALGDLDGAREAAREGLRWARQAQRPLSIAIGLQHIALLLALRGKVDDAARLVGYVNVQFNQRGIEREVTERRGYESLLDALHERLSDAKIEKLAAEGAAWPEDRAVEEALKV
jgi:tetratricopeptide (TPR) repeat protein